MTARLRRPALSATRASKEETPASARKTRIGHLLRASAVTIRSGIRRLGAASMAKRSAGETSSGAANHGNASVPDVMHHNPGAIQSVAVSAEAAPTGTMTLKSAKQLTAVSAGSLTPMQAPALSMKTMSTNAPTK